MRRLDRFRKRLVSLKLNNGGAAMVSMIVVVLFITILATTLLYISGMNFQIKQTDYRNQKSFYNSETGLEYIKAQLVWDTSEAATLAYEHTMTNYVKLGTGDARQWEYNQKFVEEIQKIWDANSGGDWLNWLKSSYIDPYLSGATLEFPGRDTNSDGCYSTSEMIEVFPDKGYVVVHDVKLTYTDSNGYTAIITTDFYVQAPTLNWAVDASETATPAEPYLAMQQVPVDVSEYVQYVNWEKQ